MPLAFENISSGFLEALQVCLEVQAGTREPAGWAFWGARQYFNELDLEIPSDSPSQQELESLSGIALSSDKPELTSKIVNEFEGGMDGMLSRANEFLTRAFETTIDPTAIPREVESINHILENNTDFTVGNDAPLEVGGEVYLAPESPMLLNFDYDQVPPIYDAVPELQEEYWTPPPPSEIIEAEARGEVGGIGISEGARERRKLSSASTRDVLNEVKALRKELQKFMEMMGEEKKVQC